MVQHSASLSMQQYYFQLLNKQAAYFICFFLQYEHNPCPGKCRNQFVFLSFDCQHDSECEYIGIALFWLSVNNVAEATSSSMDASQALSLFHILLGGKMVVRTKI